MHNSTTSVVMQFHCYFKILPLQDVSEDFAIATANEANAIYEQFSSAHSPGQKRKAIPLVVDVTSEEDVKTSINYAIEEFGKISILVNCAGIAPPMY